MSIKKLFDSTEKSRNYLTEKNSKDAFEEVESSRNLEQLRIKQEHFQPQIDYNNPEQFARFGSAILYYKSAFTRILDYYPYDGSDAEVNKFTNGNLDIENYILDNLYPRTNGYIQLNKAGYGGSTITNGYGSASNQEHIDFKGGPGTGSVTSTALKDLSINKYNEQINNSNIYDTDLYQNDGLPSNYGKGTRTSNLLADFDEGVTIEFWFKSGSITTAETHKQVLFDWWNNDIGASDSNYGRIILEMTSSLGSRGERLNPFCLTVQSGTTGDSRNIMLLGSSSLWNDMGSWHHYALRLKNSGSTLGAQLYVDGGIHDENYYEKYTLSSSMGPTIGKYNSVSSLQGWWRLNTDISAAGDAVDASGKGRDATPTVRPAYDTTNYPTPYIQSATNDFSDDFINIGTAATWDAIIGNDTAGGSTQQMTFAAWIRKTGAGTATDNHIFDFGDGDIVLQTNISEKLTFRINWTAPDTTVSAYTWITDSSVIQENKWHHVAVTYDANATTSVPALYIDGALISWVTAPTVTADSTFTGIVTEDCGIGNSVDLDKDFEGQIADAAIWNSVLSPKEVATINNASLFEKTVSAISSLDSKGAIGRIGALVTVPAGTTAAAGSGKLSGYLDEFRYWKVARNARQIGTNYFTQIKGGVNTDISNTTLGVYYKFNEGITGNNSVDKSVLDYAGRVTNGVWSGYTTGARNVGSAIISASAATKEFKDPIIRPNHPDIISLRKSLVDKGQYHDLNNNSSMLSLLPGWIIDDEEIGQDSDLQNMCHIVGAYFDKLYLQISQISRLKNLTYTSASHKPFPFAEHLPQSLGLYSPELFVDASVMEKFTNRTDTTLFEGDLHDTKNLIYSNLYNNLTAIYKSKGTEKAIKNIFRCFNIDEKLLRLTINSNREEFTLHDNVQQTLIHKNCANFNTSSNTNAVIYQYSSSVASYGPSQGYITGAANLLKYGFTAEANIVFPHFDMINDTTGRDFISSSLFGAATVLAGVASGRNLTGEDTRFANNYAGISNADVANFQITAVRTKPYSKDVYFVLESKYDGDELVDRDGVATRKPFPILTSSTFLNVYDNEEWNISVRLKPSTYPNAGQVGAGSDTYTYDLEFYGVNTINDTVANTFKVSSSISQAIGQKMLYSGKRLYVGAHRTDLTGTLVNRSDVLIPSVKYWTKYLEDSTLKVHALDVENIGISGSMFPLSPLDTGSPDAQILNSDTLALNWNFLNVTGADGTGNFLVQDFSSGSYTPTTYVGAGARDRGGYSWMDKITKKLHAGYGYGFQASSANAIDKRSMNSYRFINPEHVVSSDMITIFNDEDRLYPPTEFIPNYVYSIEKSLYNAISEEMLDFFAGVVDFNTIIGAPVNRYRDRYKSMEALRRTFFRRVNKVKQVEKYLNYYKWFDDAITSIIAQVVPASAEFVDDILNVIEPHVLERPKYQSRFPTLNFFDPEVEAAITGLDPKIYSARLGRSTLAESPRPTNKHELYWKARAERSAPEITSGDSTIDTQRETIRKTVVGNPRLAQAPIILSSSTGGQYTAKQYAKRAFNRLYKIEAYSSEGQTVSSSTFQGGVNFSPQKNLEFARAAVWPAGPINTEGGAFIPENVLFASPDDYVETPDFINVDEPANLIKKIHRVYKVQHGRDWQLGQGYKNLKSTVAFPFNIMSSSARGGYIEQIRTEVSANLDITNLHNDVYGPMMEKPLQGPFTDYAVGGLQSRHVAVNFDGTDTWHTRPEQFNILLGSCIGPPGAIGVVGPDYPWPEANNEGVAPYPLTGSKKAYLYRDFIAKRPVNIRNIQMRTGSTILGNYTQEYEVLHSFGTYANPRHFLDHQPPLPENAFTGSTRYATQMRTYLDIRRTSEGHKQLLPDYSVAYLTGTQNQQIVTTRFSNPGSVQTMGVGYRDIRGNEYSVYNVINYRNLGFSRVSQMPSGTISEATGTATPGIRLFDIHGKDIGEYTHRARHSGRFGRDSAQVTSPGASYVQLPARYKIQRNTKKRMEILADGTYATSSRYDNYNVQHQIPQSDRQYRWLSASIIDPDDIKYAGYQKTYGGDRQFRKLTATTYEPFFTFVSASDEKGTVALAGGFQPVGRLNTLTLDAVSGTENVLGFPDDAIAAEVYLNAAFNDTTNIPSASYLNLLLSRREATYGWTWRMWRGGFNSPILMEEAKANQLSAVSSGSSNLYNFSLPPVSMKGRTSRINYDAGYSNPVQLAAGKRNNITLRSSHTNEKIYFNELLLNNLASPNPDSVYTPLDSAIDMTKADGFRPNWIIYSQNVFPSMRNEFTSRSTSRIGYDNGFWRNLNVDRVVLGGGTKNSFGVAVSQSAWCLDAPVDFLTRSNPPSLIAKPLAAIAALGMRIRGKSGELQNTYLQYAVSSWPDFPPARSNNRYRMQQFVPSGLYARKHMLGSPRSVVAPSGMDIPETGTIPSLSIPAGGGAKFGAAEFASNKAVQVYSGESLWEAPGQAGIIIKSGSTSKFIVSASNPWFNDYDSFHADLKLAARGYSTVPEFRISDHSDDYIRYGVENIGVTDTFNIPGTGINSATASFYKDYSNSDFLQGFLKIKNRSMLDLSQIKLTVEAAIRFNPYRGFYPAQRTLDLVSQFSRSYGPGLSSPTGSKGVGPVGLVGSYHNYFLRGGSFRPIIQPFFAPGILYNSIKSGLAVDYPIITDATKFKRYPFGGTGLAPGTASMGPLRGKSPDNWALGYQNILSGNVLNRAIYSGSFWDKRIPFEAIIEPDIHIRGTTFLDMEPHPSCSLNTSASWTGNADEVYVKMASNFFGEVGNFFLKDRDFTNLESNVVPGDLRFKEGDTFAARVTLRRSMDGARIYSIDTGSMGYRTAAQTTDKPFNTYGYRAFVADDPSISFASGGYLDLSVPLPQDPKRNPTYRENFTMYSRPTAFGPPVSGRRFYGAPGSSVNSVSSASMGSSGSMDCFDGYNWSFTPPYYHGEAWADLVFRPDPSASYDLERIMSEINVVYWRADSGPPSGSTNAAYCTPLIPGGAGAIQGRLPGFFPSSPYCGDTINSNAMQLSSSFNLFGVERIFETTGERNGVKTNKTVGQKWIISPKWETPMLNFNDTGIHPITSASSNLTVPLYGSASVTRGMWHQFGVIPTDPEKGIFLSIDDIPTDWLNYHWMLINTGSIYNNYNVPTKDTERFNQSKNFKSLTSLFGFDRAKSKVRLGELAESKILREAVVAVPYILEQPEIADTNLSECSDIVAAQKKFIKIDPKLVLSAVNPAVKSATSETGVAGYASKLPQAGQSVKNLIRKMSRYVLPPQFDFLNNRKVSPMAMYIFEFEYKLDKDDLSYIWQNLAPRDYQKMSFQKSSVAHELFDTELLNENNLLNNPNLRWMVFKVKQKSQVEYWDLVPDQAGKASTQIWGARKKPKEGYDISYNWPYDFISFVEAIKVDVDVMYKDPNNKTIPQSSQSSDKANQKKKDAAAQKSLQNKRPGAKKGGGNY
jgi:hypothetical protein